MEEKKSTKKCVQKESKSNNVQRATFSLSGAAANKQKFKTLAAVESYSYCCSCALQRRRFSSVVGVSVAAVHFVAVLFCWLTAETRGEGEGGDKRARPSEVPSARGRFLFLFTYYVHLCVCVNVKS